MEDERHHLQTRSKIDIIADDISAIKIDVACIKAEYTEKFKIIEEVKKEVFGTEASKGLKEQFSNLKSNITLINIMLLMAGTITGIYTTIKQHIKG